MNDPDPQLRQLLNEWQVQVPNDPHFPDQVWRRLAMAHSVHDQPPASRSLLDNLRSAWQITPAWSAALVMTAIAIGLGLAAQHRQAGEHLARQHLAAVYWQNIDPLASLTAASSRSLALADEEF